MMKIFNTISDIQSHLIKVRASGKTTAFVPTMGYLHQGHLDLVKLAKKSADYVIVSIYVNPLQFGENEDLDTYPRTLESDIERLEALEVNCIFAPDDTVMYPNGKDTHTKVFVPELGNDHCGKSRPQFFGGITTVVNKLFNIIQPTISIFGEKDFQQLAIIKKMVEDLCIPTKIHRLPIVRAEDGLALSSRNAYLSDVDRKKAPLVFQTLPHAKHSLLNGQSLQSTRKEAINYLNTEGFNVDYFNICDTKTLQPAADTTSTVVILAAANLGKTRLIDNIVFPVNTLNTESI